MKEHMAEESKLDSMIRQQTKNQNRWIWIQHTTKLCKETGIRTHKFSLYN